MKRGIQGYVGYKVLRLSRFHSQLIPVMVLGIPSMQARILSLKLSFFVSSDNDSLSSQAFKNLQGDGLETSIIQQCRFLQEPYYSDFTSKILTSQGASSTLLHCKNMILKADSSLTLQKAKDHSSLKHLLELNVPWQTVWDMALEQGPLASSHAMRTLSVLTRPLFGTCLQMWYLWNYYYILLFWSCHLGLLYPRRPCWCDEPSKSTSLLYY